MTLRLDINEVTANAGLSCDSIARQLFSGRTAKMLSDMENSAVFQAARMLEEDPVAKAMRSLCSGRESLERIAGMQSLKELNQGIGRAACFDEELKRATEFTRFAGLSTSDATQRILEESEAARRRFDRLGMGSATELEQLTSGLRSHNALEEQYERSLGIGKFAGLTSSTCNALQNILEDSEAARERFTQLGLDSATDHNELKFEPVPLLEFPPNPILETNRRLESVEKRAAETTAAIANLGNIVSRSGEVVLQIQADNAEFGQRSIRISERAVRIAFVSLAVAVIIGIWQIAQTVVNQQELEAKVGRLEGQYIALEREASALKAENGRLKESTKFFLPYTSIFEDLGQSQKKQ